MKITFQWNEVLFQEKESVENKITTDIGTLLLEENDTNIIFKAYLQPDEQLTGFITDTSGKNIYSFICNTFNDYETEYNKF